MPPVNLDPPRVMVKLARDARVMFYMVTAFTVLGTIAFYLATEQAIATAGFFAIFGTVALNAGFNRHLFANDESFNQERWQFHGWCFASQPLYGWVFLIFMILLGGAQVWRAEALDSHEAVKLAFGLVFATQAESGEWWRFLTAPLLHNSLDHWMINTFIGAALLLIYGPVQRWRVIVAMVITAPASFLAVYGFYLYFPIDGEGIIGLSGGISGAIGFFLAANLRYRELFPRYYYVTTIFVALIASLLVSMMVSTASFIAHLGGFVTGLALGWVMRPVAPGFLTEA
ncbi:MAG: rhomboid family intramembrane serine protease [Pseudomonadales bacterium]|nr:rhomboid family intramembrane serine protease [Pseudomonadales bacterium]